MRVDAEITPSFRTAADEPDVCGVKSKSRLVQKAFLRHDLADTPVSNLQCSHLFLVRFKL